ncbi:MAG: hypothetical protein LBI35_06395 [Burkholderiales bacterium]|jgi:type I restriction enzyme S subunit|nr:hypothetical protein [Burkholderiales bacterium]
MRVVKLRDLLHSWDAGAWGEPATDADGVSVLRSTNFREGGLLSFENEAVLAIDNVTLAKKKLAIGDILLERSGGGPLQPVGRVAGFWRSGVHDKFICGNFISRLVPKQELVDSLYLMYVLLNWHVSGKTEKIQTATTGIRNLQMKQYLDNELVVPLEVEKQRQIAARLKAQLAEVEAARQAVRMQVRETSRLADSIILDSVRNHQVAEYSLGDVLTEVKCGIGASWVDYPVLGATRNGLAPAKEPPGKHAPKYKPVFPGTVFYNPMRILIGSIAFVDDDDAPGITSPDYVALQGKPEVVDSRWFYYWLRSPLGVQCINSLARGAVRERMLFNRLTEGEIKLPKFTIQQKAAAVLKELKPLRVAIESKLREIELLPQRLLAQAFNAQGSPP